MTSKLGSKASASGGATTGAGCGEASGGGALAGVRLEREPFPLRVASAGVQAACGSSSAACEYRTVTRDNALALGAKTSC